MDALAADLKYAFRRLRRSPAFTLVAVVSLALGIGANSAIFSVVNAVLIRDLPQDRPEELVDLYLVWPDFEWGTFSYPDLVDLRDGTGDVFEAVGGMRLTLTPMDADGGVEMLPTELVTGTWFPLQGIGAELGRTILPEDDVTPGGHPVVMLGWDYWRRAFAGDPGAVGRDLRIGGRPYTIIGVADRRYTGHIRGLEPDLLVPMSMIDEINRSGTSELEARGNQSIFARARLVSGVGSVEADAAMERVAQRLREEHPDQWFEAKGFRLLPTEDVVVHPMMDRVLVPAFGLLLVVVGVVLLIACANLASFLLARAADRRREIAVRLAMGAGRWALVRQLLVETVLLALAGGAAGLVVSTVVVRSVLQADLPLPIPISLDVSPDATVLAFTAGVSLLAGVLFGLAPALQATDPDVAPTLKNEATGGGRRRRLTLRNVLVAGQVALSMVLLVSAGLLLRSVIARQAVDPGFGGGPAALVSLQVPADRFDGEESRRVFWDEARSRLARLPGTEAVGLTSNIHLNTLSSSSADVGVDGVEPQPGRTEHSVDQARVDGAFFQAVGIPLLAGRVFDATDVPGGEPAVVVNRAFVERFWPDGPASDAVGRTFTVNGTGATVVGVVETAKIETLGEAPTPFLYRAASQRMDTYYTVVVRTSGDARRTLAGTLATIRELEPESMVYEARTMERHLATMVLPHRLSAAAASVFAALALVLASIGLYGIVSYAVASRRREVGIRLSLGADGRAVVAMLMGGGMRLVAVGVAVGLVLALAFALVLGRFLYGVPALDPLTFTLVPAVLLGVSALAAWVPARRATRVAPSEALRGD